jgi:hypothetical protein
MTRPLLILFAAALTAAVLARSAAPVAACTCAPPELPDEVLSADWIVVGEITDVLNLKSGSGSAPNPDINAIVDVERYLKGSGPELLEVDDSGSSGPCSFFDEGDRNQRYVLFLANAGSHATVRGCSYSAPLTGPGVSVNSQEQLQTIESLAGQLPRTGGPPKSVAGNDPPVLPITAAAIAVPLAFLLAAAFAWPRRRGAP